jgi:Zn-dependent protease with chaperone function
VKSFLGEYAIPGAEPVETTVLIFDKELNIGYHEPKAGPVTRRWNIQDVEAVFDRASQSTRIRNKRDRDIDIYIKGSDAATYIKEMQDEQQKPWHQKGKAREWGRNLLMLCGIIGTLILLYLLIVPWLAGKMASTVSVKTEERFGEAVYNALSLETQEDTAASRTVNEFFDAMHVRTAYDVRITVVKGEIVNAFALPGGRIVVYSALLKQMESYPELAALLSHEFTHVNNKHSTKSIFRRLGSKIFLGVLFGRMGSVTAVLADHADNLKSLKYSRGLEKEADLEGLAILQERKIDPQGFANLFMHLKKASSASMPEFLGSHPDIDKRIEYIKEASVNAPVEENTTLTTIFAQLKQNTQ